MVLVTALGLHTPSAIPFLIAEGILPRDPSPKDYTWVTSNVHDHSDDVEELLVTETCVALSRGGLVKQIYKYDIEGQPIVQAAIAWFPSSEEDGRTSRQPKHSTSGSNHRRHFPSAEGATANRQLGLFSQIDPDRSYKEDEVETHTRPDPGGSRQILSRTLVVALRTQIHVCYFSGGSHIIHFPFEIDAILPATQGIIIKRRSLLPRRSLAAPPANPPNSFAMSLGTSSSVPSQQFPSLAEVLKTPERLPSVSQSKIPTSSSPGFTEVCSDAPYLYSLSDPLVEPCLVLMADSVGSGNMRSTGATRASRLGPLPSDEDLLYVSSVNELSSMVIPWAPQLSLALAVTYNAGTNAYSLWNVVQPESKSLEALIRKKRLNASGSESHRQGSFGPSTSTGATTPIAYHVNSMRESLGTAAISQNSMLPPSMYSSMTAAQDNKPLNEEHQLASSLDLDPEAEMMPAKQARRVSSLLARADLASSQNKLPFSEFAPTNPRSSNAGQHKITRRGDSLGSYQWGSLNGQARSAYRASFPSFGATTSSENGSIQGEFADELVDGMVVDARPESLERQHEQANGSTGAITLKRIGTITGAAAEQGFPYNFLGEPRVFTLIPKQSSAAGQADLVSFSMFIVDKQKRLLVSFTVQLVKRFAPNYRWLHGKRKERSISIHQQPETVIRIAAVTQTSNIVDAVKLVEGSTSRILILEAGKEISLSLQSCWCTHRGVCLPKKLSLVNHLLPGLPIPWLKRDKSDLGRTLSTSFLASGFLHASSNGTVTLVGGQELSHRLHIQMRPRDCQVGRILDICQWILPGDSGEGILMTWWEVLRWLRDLSTCSIDEEWTALIMTLMGMVVPFLGRKPVPQLRETHSARTTKRSTQTIRSNSRAHQSSIHWDEMLHQEFGSAPVAWWMNQPGWDWFLHEQSGNEHPHVAVARRSPQASRSVAPPVIPASFKHRYLQDCLSLTRGFCSAQRGSRSAGYLPTAESRDPYLRRTAIPTILIALHLYYEELKLDITTSETDKTGTGRLAPILAQLGGWLGWEAWSWKETRYYNTESTNMERWIFDEGTISGLETPLQEFEPPSIYGWVERCLSDGFEKPFMTLLDVVSPQTYHSSGVTSKASDPEFWETLIPRTPKIVQLYTYIAKGTGTGTGIIQEMVDLGFDNHFLETLPEGLATPLRDAIADCQREPPTTWNEDALRLIGREDLILLLVQGHERRGRSMSQPAPTHEAIRDVHTICNSALETETIGAFDGVVESDRHAITRLIYREDRRFVEAARLVQSTKPAIVSCVPEPEWSESDLLEAQKDLVQTVAIRTLSVPVGRGLLYLRARLPLVTEKFPIPGFNLSCVMKPSNNTVSADRTAYTEERVGWAFFHAGVAAGLSISRDAKGVDTSWIMFNKPAELSNRHAGFLLALGLNGHLKSIAKWVAFKYLTPKHTMTSIGLLLGLAVSYLGTMDPLVTRLLSVHVSCLLPPGAAELNLSALTQTTGLMATGLLYCETQHRRMSEVMLSEMEHIDQHDDLSAPTDSVRDEGYRLAAGYALGFMNLGKGKDLRGLHDMKIVTRLLTLAIGSKRASLVHVLDKSMAAATVAIALIFMKSNDEVLARKIDAPDSTLQFAYIRPDVFLLRTVAKHLIMWDHIEPKYAWMKSNLPPEHQEKLRLKSIHALTSEDLPFLNIVAGLCLSIGLRFAGSCWTDVRDLLGYFLDQFIRLSRVPALNYDQKLTRSTVGNCQDLVALAISTVMAGTGDLHVFRRLRSLHGRTSTDVSYGSHFAAHMAIGILFLGGGTHTFGTSNLAVASLLCAFHPLLPTSTLDNKSHLQAFRHLCVLAVDPRCIVPRAVNTHRPVSIPVHITLRDGTERRRIAPCLLPELQQVIKVATASPEHWPVTLDFDQNPSHLESFTRTQSIYIRDRATYYASDSLSVFHATLQALNNMESWTARHQFEWLMQLPSFAVFDKTERALLLQSDPTASSSSMNDNSHGDSTTRGGMGNTVLQDAGDIETTLVDARLMFEKAYLNADRADRLRNLRLLFAYADRAERRDLLPLRWIKPEVVDRLRAAVWLMLIES